MLENLKRDKEEEILGTTTIVDTYSSANQSVKHGDETLLAQLGYKSEFKREFSLIETISFAMSIMGVCAAVSITLIFPLVGGGHVGMIFGWFIPSIFVMFIASSVAELASSMPTSAGLYYFSAKLAPAKYSALCSWITAWANITGQVSLVTSIDYTGAQMITTAIFIGSDGAVNPSLGATYGLFLALLFAHGIVCSAATPILARLNLVYIVINVGTSVTAITALLVGSGSNRVSTKDAFTLFENNTGWPNNPWAFILSFTAAMWTLSNHIARYSPDDSAAHISEEIANASKVVPIAILVGVGASACLGWLILIAASFATSSVSELLSSPLPLPMGQLFVNVLGKRGMLILWSFMICGQFGTGAAQGVDASRVVFAFARDNALPGSRLWKRFNRHTQTPVNAVWLVMVAAAVVGLLGFSEAALTSLAGASVIGLYTSYAIPIALRITTGRHKFVPGYFSLGRWSTPVGVIGVSWIAFVCVVFFFPPGLSPTASDMNYAVVIIMAVFIFATLSWNLSAYKWFHGPIRTINSGNREEEKESS